MPAESSIYWDSVDSQRSTSGGSSGDACSSGSRQYVDPWDLENYAYLRRHSVAGLTQQASQQHRRSSHRLSQDARAQSESWCSSSVREPGYDAPAFVEELYCGPPKPNNSCYYHQPIYEDEVPDYVASFPAYAPLSELPHSEPVVDHRRTRQRCKSKSTTEYQRAEYVDPRISPAEPGELDASRYLAEREYRTMAYNSEEERYIEHTMPPPHLNLNTYGHLKIDYTNSWNSLNRKIRK